MRYFKNKNSDVFAFESDQDEYISNDLVEMTPEEVQAHINPEPTLEQLRAKAKAEKVSQVKDIKVTTDSGKTFDGDEVAQNRMARAVAASEAGETTAWILADNQPAIVTHEELREALRLSGEAMTAIWTS